MPTPPNDDTRQLFRILADGEWHDYEVVRDALAATVPPGRALRKYEERVLYARKYKNNPQYDTQLSEDERIHFGARACAQIAITTWKGRGVDHRIVGDRKMIRKKPGFKVFGLDLGRTPADPPAQDSGPSETAARPVDEPSVKLTACVVDETVGQADPEPGDKAQPDEPVAQVGEAAEPQDEPEAGDAAEGGTPGLQERPESQSVMPEAYDTCETCGLFVSDKQLHDAFHADHPRASGSRDMALFSESEMRHLLTTVVSEELDQFQVGMQTYLAAQFALLESQIAASTGASWRVPRPPKPDHH